MLWAMVSCLHWYCLNYDYTCMPMQPVRHQPCMEACACRALGACLMPWPCPQNSTAAWMRGQTPFDMFTVNQKTDLLCLFFQTADLFLPDCSLQSTVHVTCLYCVMSGGTCSHSSTDRLCMLQVQLRGSWVTAFSC